MRAIVEGFASPCAQPYIEPDQTQNLILRHLVSYYSIDPAFVDQRLVQTKVSPNDLAMVIRGKVTDNIIAISDGVWGVGLLIKQDIMFPDLSKG